MKTVFICSPCAGDYIPNMVVAGAMSKIAVNQGFVPFISPAVDPDYDDSVNDVRSCCLTCSDELWLYIGDGLKPAMIDDIRSAAGSGKPIVLMNRIFAVSPETGILAADSYAEAPGLEDIFPVEAEPAGLRPVKSSAKSETIAGLLLALKELEELAGGPGAIIPADWWADVLDGREDYLKDLGISALQKNINMLIKLEILPAWPDFWQEAFEAQFLDEWDWATELPDLDRHNLNLVGNNEWHKLGYLLMLKGEYWRALQFLEKAVMAESRNYLAWSEIGQCSLHLCQFGMAVKAFEVALMLAPAHFYAWVGLGRSYMAVERHEEAVHAFDKALDCKENRVDPYVVELREAALRAIDHAANNVAI